MNGSLERVVYLVCKICDWWLGVKVRGQLQPYFDGMKAWGKWVLALLVHFSLIEITNKRGAMGILKHVLIVVFLGCNACFVLASKVLKAERL